MTCKHESVVADIRRILDDGRVMDFRECLRCHAWLPLGESDEHASEQVEIEIRAAEIATSAAVLDGDERTGYLDHAYEANTPSTSGQWVGYLARAIIMHDTEPST